MISNKINTKIAGISFEGRQRTVDLLELNEELILEREKDNMYDKNAIKILNKKRIIIGYINKVLAGDMAKAIDDGAEYSCRVTQITGSIQATKGVNLEIERKPVSSEDADKKYNIKPLKVEAV